MSEEADPKHNWPMRVMRAGDRRSLSRSATRALDVLEYFGQVRRPLRAVEIARRFSLHPSTVNQLLKTMVESAHLTFEARTKTYLPSPRLARFASWVVATYGSDEGLRRLIADIHALSNEVVTLTTPNDLFMQVVDLAGTDPESKLGDGDDSGAERGLRVSMFGSAIGAAYLSTLPNSEVRRQAERARIPAADHDNILKMMMTIRTTGFSDGPSAGGSIWSIAMPLPSRNDTVPLVLGLAGPVERVRPNLPQLAKALQSGIASLAARAQAESGGL